MAKRCIRRFRSGPKKGKCAKFSGKSRKRSGKSCVRFKRTSAGKRCAKFA